MWKPILAVAALLGGTAADAGTVTRATRIEIDTAIDLPAPAEEVWAILADVGAYAEWNPYHVGVSGDLAPGALLTVDIVKPNGHALTIHPRVLEIEPNRRLVWGGGPRGIFRGEHRFDLEQISPTCTRLHHSEVFSGLFVSFAELDAIEPGYRAMNEALLDRLGNRTGC